MKIFCSSNTERRRRNDLRFDSVGLDGSSTFKERDPSVGGLVGVRSLSSSSNDGDGRKLLGLEAMVSVGDMGREDVDSVETSVGEVGDMGSSDGVPGRLAWFSLCDMKS